MNYTKSIFLAPHRRVSGFRLLKYPLLGFSNLYPSAEKPFCRYLKIISHPMDLGTINKRLERGGSGGYMNHIDFSNDVQLVFDNAMKYNGVVRAVFCCIWYALEVS